MTIAKSTLLANDLRNYFLDLAIIPVETSQVLYNLDDITHANKLFFVIPNVDGKGGVRWKDLVQNIDIQESLANMQTIKISMRAPLVVGLQILEKGLLSIMGAVLIRFGYISGSDAGMTISSVLRSPWRVGFIQQPSFKVEGNIITFEFTAVSPLALTKVSGLALTAVSAKLKLGTFLRKYFKAQFDADMDTTQLPKDKIGLLEAPIMRTLKFFGLIDRRATISDYQQFIFNTQGSDLKDAVTRWLHAFGLTFRHDVSFVREHKGKFRRNNKVVLFDWKTMHKFPAVVRFGFFRQPELVGAVDRYTFPVISFDIPTNWFFLAKGSRKIIQQRLDPTQQQITQKQIEGNPALAGLDKIVERALSITTSDGTLSLKIPRNFATQTVIDSAGSINSEGEKIAKQFDATAVANINLEIETFGIPNIRAGDIVSVGGFQIGRRFSRLPNTRGGPTGKVTRDDIQQKQTINGRYYIGGLTHTVGLEGFKTKLHLLRLDYRAEGKEVPWQNENAISIEAVKNENRSIKDILSSTIIGLDIKK